MAAAAATRLLRKDARHSAKNTRGFISSLRIGRFTSSRELEDLLREIGWGGKPYAAAMESFAAAVRADDECIPLLLTLRASQASVHDQPSGDDRGRTVLALLDCAAGVEGRDEDPSPADVKRAAGLFEEGLA